MVKTTLLGFPRIGKKRELKTATEAFWMGKGSLEELVAVGIRLRREIWEFHHRAGIDLIPSNDFSFYDHVLDTYALAIRDEVRDLEDAGISFIQIDEPALREGLPLRKDDWAEYLNWAVEAFRLTSSGVKDDTQIHTHMCYSEFNDIIGAIVELDADVISIEASRSKMNLLQAFSANSYPNDIGPGVWDIHSPRIPEVEEIKTLLRKASTVLPPERLWVNPDCGLKTRALEEVIPSLQNIVAAARSLREESAETSGTYK